MIQFFSRKAGRSPLGLAPNKREYDLPFHDDAANRFLILLIGLMTYLAILSASAGLVLTSMAGRWVSGLEHHTTIEIPGSDQNGVRYTDDQRQARITGVNIVLNRIGDIVDSQIKTPKEVGKMVEPWLGSDDKVLGQIDLPTLISVTFEKNDSAKNMSDQLRNDLLAIAPDIRVETHQGWLGDVLRLTRTFSFSAYLIGFITALTTITAVGGAVRARMAAFHEQLEILHLIGAADEYIARQFQRHAFQVSLLGAGVGFIGAMLTLMIIDQLAGSIDLSLVPSLLLSEYSFLFLLIIPALLVVLTVVTTRMTVLRSLGEMP